MLSMAELSCASERYFVIGYAKIGSSLRYENARDKVFAKCASCQQGTQFNAQKPLHNMLTYPCDYWNENFGQAEMAAELIQFVKRAEASD